MRDITLADTFYQLFTTRAFATGVPTVLAGSPVVSAYENDSVTQITAGITLGVDHDGVVGLNLLTVVATGANGYEAGKDYALVITTGTVGGVSVVGEVVAEFSIERSAAAVDLANGTDGLTAIKADTAAVKTKTDFLPSATAGAAGGVAIAGSNAATTFASLTVTAATTLTGNVSMAAGLNITQSSANTSALVVTGNGTGHGAVITSGSGATGDGMQITAASTNGDGLQLTKTGTGLDLQATSTALVLAKTTNITGFNDIAATAIVSAGAITTLSGAVVNVDLVDTLTTYTGNTVQTGDSFARLGAPAGASVSADILAIDNFVDGLESTIGAAGAGLTAIPWNAAWDAEVQSEVDDALVVQRLDELLNADSDIDGAAPPTVGSVFHELLTKTAGSFTYDQTTDSLEALRDRGDAAWITATGFATSGQATAIQADTDDIQVQIGVAGAGLTAINLPDQTMNITGDITGNLSGSVGSVTGAVGSVTGNVGGNVVGTVASLASVANIFTTAMTESYRANGAAPTLAQAQFETIAHLGEAAISGVTKTIKKVDHTTTAETFTLDSATDPSSVTRAT